MQRTWNVSSHLLLEGNHSLLDGLTKQITGPKGLDAGFGPGAIDVAELASRGLDIMGVDSVQANWDVAVSMHPSIRNRLQVADLSQPLDFPDAEFDFVLCNAVIQHINPVLVESTTLPEFARILKENGILQLTFKCGSGTISTKDSDYDEVRHFQLFDEVWIVKVLLHNGMELVEAKSTDSLGGLMYFTNQVNLKHCALWARKIH